MRPGLRPCARVAAATVLAAALAGCSGGGTDDPATAPAPTTTATTSASTSSAPSTSTAASSSTRPRSSTATSSTPPSTSARPSSPRPPAPSRPAPSAGVRGATVVLNPGHNGGNASNQAYIDRQVPAGYGEYKACDTTGTNTNAGYPEHAFTFDVSLRVRRILEARGVRVVLTRPNDVGTGPCVDERAAVGNRADVAACVSIHADGATASGHGFHVNQDSRRPDGASAAAARQSIALGRAIHRTLVASSGLTPSNYIGTDGYYYRDDLAGLNLARRPTTFLELGNMRNAGDAALLSSPAGRARIASAVASGILSFLASR